ncbi:MAG: tetratricopeptide repeat protein [Candidatus Eremiobacteraeota bacterium]|nr:tetratricopeptide repeat protein [Candidatus Eremiobacteraeota bacterium]
MDSHARLEALLEATRNAYQRGDATSLEHYAGRLLEMAQAVPDEMRIAQANNYLGTAAVYQGNGERADAYFDRAIAGYRALGNNHGIVSVLIGKGVVYGDFFLDYDESRRLFDEALAIGEAAGEDRLVAFAHANIGELRRTIGDFSAALHAAQESLRLFEQLDDEASVASQFTNIAHYRALRAEFPLAIAALHDAHEKLRRHRRAPEIANYFEIWFFVAIELSRYEDAARLLGFLETYRDENTIPRLPSMMAWFVPRMERLEQRLGYEAMAKFRRAGERLSLEQANAITDSITAP